MTPPHLKGPHLNNIPWLAHGFFGRKGGVCEGEFSSLNITKKELACPDAVNENRKRIAVAVGMETAPVLLTNQKHTNTVIVIEKPFYGDGPIADAMVTRQKNILLCIQTADCVPVLFADPVNQIIGAAHAGWRGLAAGILQNTLQAMIDLGAKREHIKAAIGPCAWAESYEVGADVMEAFPQFSNLFKQWQAPTKANGTKALKTFSFDLPMAALRTLQLENISELSASPINTYTNEGSYFSFRRSTHQGKNHFGGQGSVIGIRDI
jgi:YfiH family protein